MFGIQGGRRDEACKISEHNCFGHIIGHSEHWHAVRILRGLAGFLERGQRRQDRIH